MREIPSERAWMDEGSEVEVCNKNKNGVWYKAIIIEGKPSTDLESRHREEVSVWLVKDESLSLITDQGFFFRPVPPQNMQAHISVGDFVEAEDKGGWWSGFVVRKIEDDEFLVYFDSPPDIIQFERKHLRLRFDWVGGDEQRWVPLERDTEFLRGFREECVFSSGTMVEVSCKVVKMENVWVPAMIIVETEEENHEKKYVVKFCNKSLSCKDNKARPNKIVDLVSVRPTPPPFRVEEYRFMEYVEVFHGTVWRQGQVMGILTQKRYLVLLKVANGELIFKHSDLRPLKVWEDGVWKAKELPLIQAKETGPPVTPSPGITTQPFKQTEAEAQGNTPKRTLLSVNGLGNDSTRENENSKDNNRKRKREQSVSPVASVVEENKGNDTTMDLPFVKKSPIWKTLESMEVFKTVSKSPHFSTLVETRESTRELYAVGMMYAYSGLLEEVKRLQVFSPMSTLESLNDSFAELEKHGFVVKAPQSRIHKLLSLKDRQAKKTEELKVIEKEIAERESKKVEIELKILELQRKKEETDTELEDVELEIQTTVLAPL